MVIRSSLVVLSSSVVRIVVFGMFLVSLVNFSAVDCQGAAAWGPGQSQSQPKNPCDDNAGGHDCFACCAHVVPVVTFTLSVHFQELTLVESSEPSACDSEPMSHFRPPKA